MLIAIWGRTISNCVRHLPSCKWISLKLFVSDANLGKTESVYKNGFD